MNSSEAYPLAQGGLYAVVWQGEGCYHGVEVARAYTLVEALEVVARVQQGLEGGEWVTIEIAPCLEN